MNNCYLLGGRRSYIGIENGIYRHVPAEQLGAAVLKEVVRTYSLDQIDLIIGGNGVGAGGNITRLALLEAGIGNQVPALTVDLQCASALEAIAIGAAKIACGQAEVVVAGGFESSSTRPQRAYSLNHPLAEYGAYQVAKFSPGEHRQLAMLEGAEKTARVHQISREELDEWALYSHKRALEARDSKVLEPIIAPVLGRTKDEGIRKGMSAALLRRLPPVYSGAACITAGNACLTHDGAAFVVLVSKEYVERKQLQPIACVRDSVLVAGTPEQSPCTAIQAVDKLLKKQHLTAQEVAAFEVNEAFAVIDVLFERTFQVDRKKYNCFGGALAYGHPYGASGAIIMLHLLRAMQTGRHGLGVCAVAAAGGVGSAMLIESV